MSASRTGLTKYIGHDGSKIFASEITAIVPYVPVGAPPGSMTLKLGVKKANLVGSWISQHQPQVGGFFVCYDLPDGQTLCRYESATNMAQKYTRAVPA